MHFNDSIPLEKVLKALFEPYRQNVTDVNHINTEMVKLGMIAKAEDIENDHIAFRTLGVENLGIASLEIIFLHLGYTKRDHYHFENKKLDAFWYAPPEPKYPRIFISELRVNDLSLEAQETIKKYTSKVVTDPVADLDMNNAQALGDFFYKPLWEVPTLEDYELLADESEYAAWVIYNRYYLNHYTISVHNLPKPYNKLETFNAFLEEIGIVLNSSGGKIKTSSDGLLKQSSSVAKMITAQFADGKTKKISSSYVEFAERLPEEGYEHLNDKDLDREKRRDGFEANNADKIFESTYDEQTKRSS